MTRESPCALHYSTGEQVLVGDRIQWRPLFGRRRSGVVSYIPDHSASESPATDDPPHWAWDLSDGSRILQIYIPEELQPGPRMRLLSRGEPPTDSPVRNPLLEIDEDDEPPTGVDFLKLLLLTVPVGLALVLLIVYLQHR